MPWGLHVSLAYVGSNGVHLIENQEEDTNIPEIQANGVQYRPPAGSVAGTDYGYTPNTYFGEIVEEDPEGNSHYNGGTLNVQRNLGNGIQFQSGFTWSRSIDWGSSGLGGVDVGNDSSIWVQPHLPERYNKAFCSFNVTNNWTSNALIPLPFHGNKLKEGMGAVAFISILRNGNPVTPTSGFDRANLGEYFNANAKVNVNPAFTGPLIVGTQKEWFNPAAFTLQPAGYVGNASRNMIPGPGEINVDFSLIKRTAIRKLGEGTGLEIRADAFNVFNHTNFAEPGSSIYANATGVNPTAGVISSTQTHSRQRQLSARLVF